MKKVALLALLTGAIFVSCSDDDNNSAVNMASVDGTWKLTAFNLNESFDLNNDGTLSQSLISESGCYNNSQVVFDTNGGAVLTLEELEIDMDLVVGTENTMEYTLNCLPGTTETGTYEVSGNTVIVNSSNGDIAPISLVRAGNTLTLTLPAVTSVPVEDENGDITYDFVGGTMVFTKQ